jgi:putative Mn2+ efflux pump MntP
VLGLALVAVSLGASNLAAAIAIGLGGVDAQTRRRVALIFGVFEAGMPLVGLAIGREVAGSLGGSASGDRRGDPRGGGCRDLGERRRGP